MQLLAVVRAQHHAAPRGAVRDAARHPSYVQLHKEVCGLRLHLMGPFTVFAYSPLCSAYSIYFFPKALEMFRPEQTASVQGTNIYGHFPGEITVISRGPSTLAHT